MTKRLQLLLLGFSLALIGCNQREQTLKELKEYGKAWTKHHDDRKRGPASWRELEQFAPAGLQQSLQASGYQFVWDTNYAYMSKGTVNSPLAYPQEFPVEGGLVLFADQTVRFVTADEFDQEYKEIIEDLRRGAEWGTTIRGPWLSDDTFLAPGDKVGFSFVGEWLTTEVVRLDGEFVVVRVPSLRGGPLDSEKPVPRYSIRVPPATR